MVEAFILVNIVEKSDKRSVFNSLRKIAEVKRAYIVSGNYDFALELEDSSWIHLKETLAKRLSFAGVKSSVVMMRSKICVN